MAGPSGKPLVEKLGLKPGMKARLMQAVYAPPAGVGRTARAPLDFIHLFTKRRATLWRQVPRLAGSLAPAGMPWVSRPKRASGMDADLTQTVVREAGWRADLVDLKVYAVDEVWSGLRFVIRQKNR